jgi:O-antigen ligase
MIIVVTFFLIYFFIRSNNDLPFFIVFGIFIFEQTLIPWGIYFQGLRHLTSFIYIFIFGYYYYTKTKYVVNDKFKMLDRVVLAFGAFLLFSMIYSRISGTPFSHISTNVRFWLHGIFIYLFTSRLVLSSLQIKKIFHYLVVLSFTVTVLYVYVYFFAGDGLNFGYLFNKVQTVTGIRVIGDLKYSMFLITTFVIFRINKIPQNRLLYLSLPFIVFAFFIHQTRAYLIALIFVLAISSLIEYKKFITVSKEFIILTLLLLVSIVLIGFFSDNILSIAINRFGSLLLGFENIDTMIGRQNENLWALNLWEDNNSLIGIGLGSDKFLQYVQIDGREEPLWGNHNNYAFLLVSTGIIGLLLYMMIWGISLYQFFKYRFLIIDTQLRSFFLVGFLLIFSRLLQGISTNISDGSPFVWMMFLLGINISILRNSIYRYINTK